MAADPRNQPSMAARPNAPAPSKPIKYPDRWSPNFHKTYIGKLDGEHFSLMEKIEMEYSILYNADMLDSNRGNQLIQLCERDIAISKELKGFWEHESSLPNVPTFKRLAIIYEKLGKYDEAIDVCKRGIELGFIKDDTKGGLPGRLAKLMKKAGRQDELKQMLNNGDSLPPASAPSTTRVAAPAPTPNPRPSIPPRTANINIHSSNLTSQQLNDLNKEHLILWREEEMKYSQLFNANMLDRAHLQEVIDLCKRDIEIAIAIRHVYLSSSDHQPYMAFRRLATIYEDLGMFDDAIAVCKQGIALGYERDGTIQGLSGRLANLMKKAGRLDELQQMIGK